MIASGVFCTFTRDKSTLPCPTLALKRRNGGTRSPRDGTRPSSVGSEPPIFSSESDVPPRVLRPPNPPYGTGGLRGARPRSRGTRDEGDTGPLSPGTGRPESADVLRTSERRRPYELWNYDPAALTEGFKSESTSPRVHGRDSTCTVSVRRGPGSRVRVRTPGVLPAVGPASSAAYRLGFVVVGPGKCGRGDG